MRGAREALGDRANNDGKTALSGMGGSATPARSAAAPASASTEHGRRRSDCKDCGGRSLSVSMGSSAASTRSATVR